MLASHLPLVSLFQYMDPDIFPHNPRDTDARAQFSHMMQDTMSRLHSLSCHLADPKRSQTMPTLPRTPPTDLLALPARNDARFNAGCLPQGSSFWFNHVLPRDGLPAHLNALIRKWLTTGVSIFDFLTPFKGEFLGESFDSPSPPAHTQRNHSSAHENHAFVSRSIAENVASGALRLASPDCPPLVILPLAVASREGKDRLITDAQFDNLWQQPNDVSYDSLAVWSASIGHGDRLFSVDHKSGYLNVPLDPDSYRYFGVEWEGVVYESTVMVFGWSPACFVYQTLSRAFAGFMRSFGVNLLAYLDDFGFAIPARLPLPLANELRYTIFSAIYLTGLYTGRVKSQPTFTHSLRLLGFIVDSREQCFRVPPDKCAKIFALADSVLAAGSSDVRTVQKLAGKLQALALALPAVSIFTRSMYDAIKACGPFPAPFAPVAVSPQMRADVDALRSLQAWHGTAPWRPAMHYRVETDASSHTWSAVAYMGPAVHITGMAFTQAEASLHINVKELIAVDRGLQRFSGIYPPNSRIDVFVDNTVVEHSGTRGSSPDMMMREMSRQLLQWQLASNTSVRLHRVPTSDNTLADIRTRCDPRLAISSALTAGLPPVETISYVTACTRISAAYSACHRKLASRPLVVPIDRGDHRLNPQIFAGLQQLLGVKFTIDICASHRNSQTPRYIAMDNYIGDPLCIAANVLCYAFPHPDTEFVYCNPPWSIIGPVWCHLRQRGCKGVLLFPYLPYNLWYPMVFCQASHIARLARQGDPDVFFQPSRDYLTSVGPLRWDLMFAVFDFSSGVPSVPLRDQSSTRLLPRLRL